MDPVMPPESPDNPSSFPLPKQLAGLLDATAYPHAVTSVTVIQTHLSWVLLTGEVAYKIKRPVHYAFADFRDPAHRAWLCSEELRLNQRFAPGIYLGTSAIREQNGQATLVGDGPQIETAVRMRQFDRRGQLDRLVEQDQLSDDELDAFGQDLASLHQSLPSLRQDAEYAQPAHVRKGMLDNLNECMALNVDRLSAQRLHSLKPTLERRSYDSHAVLLERAAAGHFRECHGDLHLSNIVRIDGRCMPFDALEFEPAFRWIDVADELAFTVADLTGYAHPTLATAFLNGYFAASGDYDALRVLDLFVCHRALVRAKIMMIRRRAADADLTQQAHWQRRFIDYLSVAESALNRPKPTLVLMHGLAGSGKTWLARQLARQMTAVHVRSDIERKRLAGLGALARTEAELGSDLYDSAHSGRSYARLHQCASAALSGGWNVICDAAFLRRRQRDLFYSLAADLGLKVLLIHCTAPDPELQRRLGDRQALGKDASEADATVLDWQRTHVDSISSDEITNVITIDTTQPGALDLARAAWSPS